MIIVGIDPSLTGTGLARVDTQDRLVVETNTISSTGRRDDTYSTRHQRIAFVANEVRDTTIHYDSKPDLVVIEAPTLSQGRQGGHLDRHGLWWFIIDNLHAESVPYAVVTASARAKYATGKGNAPKDTVLLEVARRFPHVDLQNNNEADALILAAMGARWAGTPIDEMPKTHTDALAKVEWPFNELVA